MSHCLFTPLCCGRASQNISRGYPSPYLDVHCEGEADGQWPEGHSTHQPDHRAEEGLFAHGQGKGMCMRSGRLEGCGLTARLAANNPTLQNQ